MYKLGFAAATLLALGYVGASACAGENPDAELLIKLLASCIGAVASLDFAWSVLIKHKPSELGVLEHKMWTLVLGCAFVLCFSVYSVIQSVKVPLALAKTCIG